MRLALIDEIEQYLYDVRMRWTMPRSQDPRIVIINIDERSIAAEGHFPWQRDKMAQLVDTLFDHYRVRVAAFDMVFAEPEESTALQLIGELRNLPKADTASIPIDELEQRWQTDRFFAESLVARNVVLGFTFKPAVPEGEPARSGLLPFPSIYAEQIENIDLPLYDAAGYVGNFSALQEMGEFGGFFSYPRLDDVIRRTPLLQSYEGDLYETLGLAAARVYLGNPPIQLEFASGEEFTGLNLENIKLGELRIPVDERAQAYIPFRGLQGSFPYASATDVLNRKVTPSLLLDKLVIIGTTAAGLLDLRATPVSETYAGVEIHASLVSGILDQRFIYSPSYINAVELVLLVANLLLMALLLPRLSPAPVALTLAGLLVGNTLINLYLWETQRLVIPLAALLIGMLSMAFLQVIYEYFVEFRRKQRLGRIFGQYIPVELVDEINTSGSELGLEGESREMTVLFSDVRGFTTTSENLEPQELTRFMNEILTPITRIIHDKRGTIDKYMGDAVMAFWGAPLEDTNHAQHAVAAAMEIVRAMERLSGAFSVKGWPAIRLGIGISTGKMNVGNMGSEFRMAYTVLGDVVNLGSRLEGQTELYGAEIIISEQTATQVQGMLMRELDLIQVKGKTAPIRIYQPLCREIEATRAQRDELADFERALELYRARDFNAARQVLEALRESAPQPLYDLYLQRINAFLKTPPPEDWKGVYVAEYK